ncbi:ATP synthase subunit I [Alteromonadaceae bacterium BrNp21-10]|nr:ATP synthase subunit I [Alteromonadaceae bacterium BrNp21-10]
MNQLLAASGRNLVNKILLFQTCIALLSAGASALFWQPEIALAVFFGAMVSAMTNFIFGTLAFRYAGASKNKLVVKSFNQGLKLKLILTMVLFIVAFQWLALPAMPLLVGFIITLVAQWPYMIFLSQGEQHRDQ